VLENLGLASRSPEYKPDTIRIFKQTDTGNPPFIERGRQDTLFAQTREEWDWGMARIRSHSSHMSRSNSYCLQRRYYCFCSIEVVWRYAGKVYWCTKCTATNANWPQSPSKDVHLYRLTVVQVSWSCSSLWA